MNNWYEQIWDNPQIQIENKLISLKHYFNAGIFLLFDLYNLDGKFLNYEQFLDMNIKTNFIEYCGIKKAVSSRTKQIAFFDKTFGLHIPSSIRIFLKNEKGCKDMDQLLVYACKQVITAVQNGKLMEIIIQKKTWSRIFELPFIVTQETELRWL